MKTKEEFDRLKEELCALNNKLSELNDEKLSAVTGGDGINGAGVNVEVGKWYKLSPLTYYRNPSGNLHWYCAEDVGENRFRFEIYVSAVTANGEEIIHINDMITFGVGFEECEAPAGAQ